MTIQTLLAIRGDSGSLRVSERREAAKKQEKSEDAESHGGTSLGRGVSARGATGRGMDSTSLSKDCNRPVNGEVECEKLRSRARRKSREPLFSDWMTREEGRGMFTVTRINS
jgi:hypothetical protein